MDAAFTQFKKLKLFQQRGAALLLVTLTIAVGAAAFTIKAINQANLQIEREKTTNQSLALAKTALIGWSVSHASLPGSLPFPDRNGDGNYDGESDCYSTIVAFSYSFLLGELPIADSQDTNCLLASRKGLNIDARDGYGNRLWYAVSRNLVRNYNGVPSDPIINPGIIANPTYSWLTVYDKNGQLVSNRVAAVIIAPGSPTASQDRSAVAPAATQYLDSFTLAAGGGVKSNRTYVFQDEDFFVGEDARNISGTDAVYDHPYEFNDKLVFITIDELMAEVEKRAAMEAKTALNNYFEASDPTPANRFYPFAAPLANPMTHSCQASQTFGLLPTTTSLTTSCTCASNINCTCAFSKIANVQYVRSSTTATWTSNTGACIRAGHICTCTGTGSCTRTSRTFSCNSTTGVCALTSGTASGTIVFNGAFTNPAAKVNTTTGACTIPTNSCGAVSCAGAGSFSYTPCTDTPFTGLPTWFTTNNWQDYFYYSISRATPTLTAGAKTGVTALLVATGTPINNAPFAVSKAASQSVPSCNVNDYLDSSENANADTIFDAANLPKSSSYNDRTFIVAP